MHLCQPAEYNRARPLFQAINLHLATTATIAGPVLGCACVDDADMPRVALLGEER